MENKKFFIDTFIVGTAFWQFEFPFKAGPNWWSRFGNKILILWNMEFFEFHSKFSEEMADYDFLSVGLSISASKQFRLNWSEAKKWKWVEAKRKDPQIPVSDTKQAIFPL